MRLYLAPAGQGKTAFLLDKIIELRRQDLLAPAWVIVPNQMQASAFRRRLAEAGGALAVEVTTFYRLYARILAAAGLPKPRLHDPVQHRLLRAVVDTLSDEGQLQYYAPLRDKPGFLRRLRDVILELKQARVEPEDLHQALAQEEPALHELAAIYSRYQAWLHELDWADAEGLGWLAAQALERDPHLVGDVRLLAVDGFDEFNPTQVAVLRLLAQRVPATVITLTGELPDDSAALMPPDHDGRDAYRRFRRAAQELARHCPELEIHSLPRPHTPTPGILRHLERSLFVRTHAPSPESVSSPLPLILVEARNRHDEVRVALRWLKHLIVEERVQPSDCAVLARELAPYRPYLSEVASEYGLPLHLAGGEELLDNPCVAALLTLAELPILDWPQREVLESWRSPYFDWTHLLTGQDCFDTIEQAAQRLAEMVRASRVMAGLDQWQEAFRRRVAIQALDEIEEEDRSLRQGPIGREAEALQIIFDAFVRRLTPREHAPLEEHVAWLEDLIGPDPVLQPEARTAPTTDPVTHLGVVARARESQDTAERDISALQTLKDLLRGLLLADVVSRSLTHASADADVPYQRFFDELRGAAEATTYRIPPPEGGGIPALSVLQARGISFRAVALLGLSEGEFPRREQEDPVLTESARNSLRARGLPLTSRLRGDEITLFYEAVTRARHYLLLTRPALTDDGQPWLASPYWNEVTRVCGVTPSPADQMFPPASPAEYLAMVRNPPEDGEYAAVWDHVRHTARVLRARLEQEAAGAYEGDLSAITSCLQQHYRPTYVWSSSSLETYAACPFQFFVSRALGLEAAPKPEVGFDQLILGSIYHEALELLYRTARERGDWSRDALLELLPEVAQSIFDEAPRRYGFRPSPLWEYQQRELTAVLRRTIDKLCEREDGYAPHALERAFGIEGHPKLVIKDGHRELHLRGYIDRVDRHPAGHLRIIDYKSGSTAIKPGELREGKRIQLPLYALAAEQALGLGRVQDGFYWHINGAQPSSLTLAGYDGGIEAALKTAREYAFAYVEAIREGKFHPKPPSRGCPQSCPALPFCWRYRPGH